jgi:hypothetical protein
MSNRSGMRWNREARRASADIRPAGATGSAWRSPLRIKRPSPDIPFAFRAHERFGDPPPSPRVYLGEGLPVGRRCPARADLGEWPGPASRPHMMPSSARNAPSRTAPVAPSVFITGVPIGALSGMMPELRLHRLDDDLHAALRTGAGEPLLGSPARALRHGDRISMADDGFLGDTSRSSCRCSAPGAADPTIESHSVCRDRAESPSGRDKRRLRPGPSTPSGTDRDASRSAHVAPQVRPVRKAPASLPLSSICGSGP